VLMLLSLLLLSAIFCFCHFCYCLFHLCSCFPDSVISVLVICWPFWLGYKICLWWFHVPHKWWHGLVRNLMLLFLVVYQLSLLLSPIWPCDTSIPMFPNLGSTCPMVTWLTRFCACYPYSCLSSDRGTHRFPCFQTWDRCVPRWYGRQELCHTLLHILMFPTVHQLPLCSKSMSYDWKTYNLRQIFSVLSFFGLWWLELIYYSCLSSNRETHPCPCFQTWDGCVPRFNDCHESSVSLLLQVQVVWGHFCMFLWWYDLWYCTVRPMMILFTIYLSWHPSNHARRPCPCFSNWGWTSHMVPWLPWNICYSFIYLRPQFPIF
jgi:hypothetical protein